MEIAPLRIDDLAGHEANLERLRAAGMGAGNLPDDFDQEIVGNDLVVGQNTLHETVRLVLGNRLAQGAFVVPVAGTALARAFGDLDHFFGLVLAILVGGGGGSANSRATSRSASKGSAWE